MVDIHPYYHHYHHYPHYCHHCDYGHYDYCDYCGHHAEEVHNAPVDEENEDEQGVGGVSVGVDGVESSVAHYIVDGDYMADNWYCQRGMCSQPQTPLLSP